MTKTNPVSIKQVEITNGLLAERAEVVRTRMIPYQWEALNDRVPGAAPSYAVENLRIAVGEKSGKHRGFIFQDSDLYKWLEAVGYSLATHPDAELERTADELIDLLARVQQPDGYLNSYYTIMEPDKRWTNLRDNHELYCAGHLIEAAVAYYEGTGKRTLLDIACRFVDHIASVFGPELTQKKGYPGHQEIELALVRLYRITQDPKHLELAEFFIDERGKTPHYFQLEADKRGETHPYWYKWGFEYSQSHLPVREQDTAVGHAVRAMYMYCAMVDVARETNDQELFQVCKRLWDNVVTKRMYITGGLGSQEFGEGFSTDYDLPNDTAYTETCAAVGLVFWAHRMLQVEPDRQYADIMERALYNGVLSGMSLSGDKFFYVNPLQVWPHLTERRHDHHHVRPSRQDWFGCACCPPNIARLLTSIGQYGYSVGEDSLYVHLFIESTLNVKLQGVKVKISQTTKYPFDGKVTFTVEPEKAQHFNLFIRIPSWCQNPQVSVAGKSLEKLDAVQGYIQLSRTWHPGDQVELVLSMSIERVRANPLVRENMGKVALQRGPLVYCLEEEDCGPNLPAVFLPREAELTVEDDPVLKMPVIVGEGLRQENNTDRLYFTDIPKKVPVPIKAVPYFAWNNRRPGEMLVWINEKE